MLQVVVLLSSNYTYQSIIDEQSQLRQGGIAAVVLTVHLQSLQHAGVQPRYGLWKQVPTNDL